MVKEFKNSEEFLKKEEETLEFYRGLQKMTPFEKFSLKSANTFNTLLYCYEQNGIKYDHLGITDEQKNLDKTYAQWSQQSKYSRIGKFTGEKLREDIESKILEYYGS